MMREHLMVNVEGTDMPIENLGIGQSGEIVIKEGGIQVTKTGRIVINVQRTTEGIRAALCSEIYDADTWRNESGLDGFLQPDEVRILVDQMNSRLNWSVNC